MSLLTAQLVTAEVLPKLVENMAHTPASWAAQNEEVQVAQRRGQELTYLQTCYEQVLSALPPTLGRDQVESLQALLGRLQESCSANVDRLCEMGGGKDNRTEWLASVPKYYYSEMRRRRQCVLPPPPQHFTETSLLAFLSLEAAAALRRAERYRLLAKERGEAVPKKSWEDMGDGEMNRARDILAVLFVVFGETRVEADLNVSICREGEVSSEMLDDSQGRVRFGKRPLLREEDPEEDLGDEEDEVDECDVLLGTRPVFIVSDCTGESATHTVGCALGQLGHCFDRSVTSDMTTFRFVTEGEIDDIVESAKKEKAFIVFTLVDPTVNAHMVRACEESGVEHHDLWGQLLEKMEGYFDVTRTGVPGRTQVIDDNYMNLIECIEYTRTLDDGVLPNRWSEADIIILGPSRTGKTPLSFFMSQRGYKVANYPIVPDEELPKELWEFDQERVFALIIDPTKLANIRNTRMKTLNMGSNTQYAQTATIHKELNWCKQLYAKNPSWKVIDTTHAGVEESSAQIMRILYNKGFRSRTDNSDNPSAI